MLKRRHVTKTASEQAGQYENLTQDAYPQLIDPTLERTLEIFHELYAKSSDVIFRSITIGGKQKAALIFIEGLADSEGIEEYIFKPLLSQETEENCLPLQAIKNKLAVPQVSEFHTVQKAIAFLSNGYPILLVGGENTGLAIGLTKWEKRAIEEPPAESGIRGPREGFTETLRISTSQIRRIIKSPRLKMESIVIGQFTQTNIVIAYMNGIADLEVVERAKKRIQSIQIDGILESGYIEEMIIDFPYSPFPQFITTERPDVTCANLLEGRIAIITEGTPFVLIAPITFASLMQSQEDYYQGYIVATMTRWLRYIFGAIALFLPSLYVAILTFHQEMIPGSLLISMASSREMVPFPALIEALMMEIFFEALREAGIRLPKQIGSAVSIVGALVIGQAAVQAGLISAPMVIVVALGGISSFMIPRYTVGVSVRILRFPMIVLAGTLGLVGIMLGFIAMLLHLSHIHSLGVPYLSTLSAPKVQEIRDVFVRSPLWMMDKRPQLTSEVQNAYRQAPDQKPETGEEEEGSS